MDELYREWVDVSEVMVAPQKVEGSDFTHAVMVAVVCENGLRFLHVDRFDTVANYWVKFCGDDDRRVIAWQHLPPFPSFISTINLKEEQ